MTNNNNNNNQKQQLLTHKDRNIHGYLCAVVTKKGQKPRQISFWEHNLLTTVGIDFYHSQCLIAVAASNTKGANQIAVTESTITPAVGNTTLSGEVTTNGLSRTTVATPASTINHTNGTNSSTIENIFTATGSFTSVLASAIFNADSAGTMTHIANFSTGSGTLISGDTLKVTWTINIG